MAERAGTSASGAPQREGGLTTFSFQVGNPVSAAQPSRTGAPMRGGVQAKAPASVPQISGAGVDRATAIAAQDLDNLMRFAGAVIGPRVEKEQDAAYWEGVKKAATGQGIKEILEERPWYSKIFGDTPMVQGARAYTAQTNLDNALASIAEDMPELRKQSPDAVAKLFVQRLDGMMTGDPVTDGMLKKAASEQLPLLLKTHSKEHYGYMQASLKQAQFNSWMPKAAALQAAGASYAAGTLSEKDWKTIQAQTLSSLLPIDGQNEESWRSNMLAAHVKFAQDGNFHMVKLLNSTGYRSQLKPEEQKSLDDNLFRYGQRAKAEYVSTHMAEDLGAFGAVVRTNPGNTKYIADTARQLNEKFRKATGIDEDVVDVQRSVESAAVVLFNDQRAELTRAQKAEANVAQATAGFASGYGSSSYADTGMSRTEADTAFRRLVDGNDNQIKIMIDNAVLAPEPFVSPSLAGEFRANVQGSMKDQWNDGMANTYMQWKKLASTPNGGEATAMAYFGDYHSQFKALDSLIQGGTPADVAYDRVFVNPPPKNPQLSKENAKKLQSGIDEVDTYEDWRGMFGGIFGRPLSTQGRNALSAVLAPKFDSYMQMNPGLSPAEAAKHVAKAAIASGEVEMYGNYVWQKDINQTSLAQYVWGAQNGPREWVNESVEAVINTRLTALGVPNPDEYTMFRAADANGEPILYVTAYNEGNATHAVIRGSEVKAAYDLNFKRKKAETPVDVAPTYTRPGTSNVGWGGVIRQ